MGMRFEESRLSFVMAMGTAFGVLLALSAFFTAVPLGTGAELAAIGIVVSVVSWWSSPAASLAVGLVAFLFVSGFVLGQQGALTWDGTQDVPLLLVFALVAVSASLGNRLRLTARSRHFQGGHIHG